MSVIKTIHDAYLSPPLPTTNENPGMDEFMPIEDARRHAAAWILAALPVCALFASPPSAKLHPVLALIVIVSMLAAVNALIWVTYFVDLWRMYQRTDAYRADERAERGRVTTRPEFLPTV